MEQIKTRHAICLTLLFTLETTLSTIGNLKHHTYQSLILAFIIVLPFLFLYQYLLKKHPGKNLFEIISQTMWGFIAKIILILYILFLIYMVTSSAFSYLDFAVNINVLNQTQFYLLIFAFIMVGYLLKSGLKVIGKVAQVTLLVSIVMIAFLAIISLKNFQVFYLQPYIPYYKSEFWENVMLWVVCPLGESFILFNIFCSVENSKKKNRLFTISIPLAVVLLLIIILDTVGTIGIEYFQILDYPYYGAVAILDAMRFIAHIEALSSGVFFCAELMKTIIIIYSIDLAMKSCFNIKKEVKVYLPYVLLMYALAIVMFDSLSEINNFIKYYCYVAMFFAFIIPIILGIITFFKNRYVRVTDQNNINNNVLSNNDSS